MRFREGFTLLELLIVVAILGVLGAIGGYTYNSYVSDAKQEFAIVAMRTIAANANENKMSTGFYTPAYGRNVSLSSTASIEAHIFNGRKAISEGNTSDDPYYFRFYVSGSGYYIYAYPNGSNCNGCKRFRVDHNNNKLVW